MMSHIQSPTIDAAISELYEMPDVPLPTAQRCVVPLAELVGSLNLICTELDGLTNYAAISYLLQHGGLIEPPDECNQEPLAGFLYATAKFGAIFAERSDLFVRRRFSIAHELGHYLLHFRPLLTALEASGEPVVPEAMDAFPQFKSDLAPDDLPTGNIMLAQAMSASDIERMEREANRFAVELLMPEAIVRELVAKSTPYFKEEDLVWRLATEMLVSRATMRWRLQNLGLLLSKGAAQN